MKVEGYEVGSICNRDGCAGVIVDDYKPDGGCSCHISPPCGYCMIPKERCPDCDWLAADDDGGSYA